MTIMERIEQLNAERGWSLYELSKRTDIAEATVYTWKRKHKNPSIPVLEHICESYGITLYQFFMGIYDSGLTDDQNELIVKWTKLEAEDKKIINELMDRFIRKK